MYVLLYQDGYQAWLAYKHNPYKNLEVAREHAAELSKAMQTTTKVVELGKTIAMFKTETVECAEPLGGWQ